MSSVFISGDSTTGPSLWTTLFLLVLCIFILEQNLDAALEIEHYEKHLLVLVLEISSWHDWVLKKTSDILKRFRLGCLLPIASCSFKIMQYRHSFVDVVPQRTLFNADTKA